MRRMNVAVVGMLGIAMVAAPVLPVFSVAPATAADYLVTSGEDTGFDEDHVPGSLRAAVESANESGAAARIEITPGLHSGLFNTIPVEVDLELIGDPATPPAPLCRGGRGFLAAGGLL